MKQSDSITRLAASLVRANKEITPIAKDGVNPHFRSKFATLDAIMVDVRPILASHGLAVIQGATTPHTNEAGTITAFTVETMLVHESGEWVLSSVVMPIVKSDPQGAGAAVTYGRRYGISALLGLSTDEDDDGNNATQRSGGEKRGGAQVAPRQTGTATTPSRPVEINQRSELPFGKSKGTKLTTMSVEDLSNAVQWARENKPEKYAEFIDAAELIMAEKTLDLVKA